MTCVYCDRPLDCLACDETYSPPGLAEYEALSRPEVPVTCPSCGSILTCRWCRTPYDGRGGEGDYGDDLGD